jgi:hypothetical protein
MVKRKDTRMAAIAIATAAGLGVGAHATVAHAAPLTTDFPINVNLVDESSGRAIGMSDALTPGREYMSLDGAPATFTVKPTTDEAGNKYGIFEFRTPADHPLEAAEIWENYVSYGLGVTRSSSEGKTAFFLMPGSKKSSYKIRVADVGAPNPIGNLTCLTASHSSNPLSGPAPVQLEPCNQPGLQEWRFEVPGSAYDPDSYFQQLAVDSALSACTDDRPNVAWECAIGNPSASEPEYSKPLRVSEAVRNDLQTQITHTLGWTHSTTTTNTTTDTQGNTVGGGAELGGGAQGISVKFSAKYEHQWSKASTHSITEATRFTERLTIPISPLSTGWVVRQNRVVAFSLPLTVTYFATEKTGSEGNPRIGGATVVYSLIHVMTRTVDGQNAGLVTACDTASTSEVCKATTP